ncbi:MAG: hypothetical protein J0L65_02155 [Xanthomonadales bacterium]|nr:hypothetical protein [Xanthomonadales bacterium]TXI79364.1 MAG: hypothetical protein E6Q44_09370 [Flavobacteriales bacterium]
MDGDINRKPTVVFQDRIDNALRARPIDHLVETLLPVEVRIDGEPFLVNVRVHYTNHCWTRTRKGEAEDTVLFCEHHRDRIDERIFCEQRWEFSKQLPGMIRSISHSLCLPGGSRELFYRVMADPKKGGNAGWYACIRLDANRAQQEITLSIRSVHYRTTRPADIRGAPQRFWALFWDFYKDLRTKNSWVVAGETKKNPPA